MKTLKILAVLLLITLQVNGQNAVIDAIGYVPPIEDEPIIHCDSLVLYPNLSIRENLNRIDSVLALHKGDGGDYCLVMIYGEYPVNKVYNHIEYLGRIDEKETLRTWYNRTMANVRIANQPNGRCSKKYAASYRRAVEEQYSNLTYNEMEEKGKILLSLYTHSFTPFPGCKDDVSFSEGVGGCCYGDFRGEGVIKEHIFYHLYSGELYDKIEKMIYEELGIEKKQYIASTPQKEKRNITAQYQF